MATLTFFADVLNALLTLFLGYLFYDLFGKRKYNVAIRLTCVALVSAIFLLTLRYINTGFLRFFILMILTFSITVMFEMKLLHRIIYSLIYVALCVLSEGIAAICFSRILNIDMNYSTIGLFYVIGTLISKLIVLICFLFIRVKQHKPIWKTSRKHLFFLLMMPLSTLIILILQYNYNYIVSIPIMWAWVLSVAYLLLVLSNIAVFDYIDSLYQNAIDKGNLIMTSQIVKEQEKRYTTIQEHYHDIASFRHDQKNINIGILNELKEKNIESAIVHLQESISVLSAQNIRSAGIIYTVVDIKSEIAQQHGIEFIFDYQILPKISISDIDIAVLLGNALDNAIDANLDLVASKRYIELLITVHNKNLIIYIKNPTNKKVDIQNLISTKNDRSHIHGFGITSMKQIVNKFKGDIVFKSNDSIFEVNIVIPNIFQEYPNND